MCPCSYLLFHNVSLHIQFRGKDNDNSGQLDMNYLRRMHHNMYRHSDRGALATHKVRISDRNVFPHTRLCRRTYAH